MSARTVTLSIIVIGLFCHFILFAILDTSSSLPICAFKNSFGWPCPMCGSLRSVVLFYRGEFSLSVQTNPMGSLAVILFWTVILLSLFDVFSNQKLIPKLYSKVSTILDARTTRWTILLIISLIWIKNLLLGT